MLDIIKIIVEIMKGGLNGAAAVKEFQEEKRRRELGVELATFYIELCRIIGTAKSIIHSMEAYSQRMEGHLKDGNDEYALTAGNWIKREVSTQKINIARLSKSAKRLESILILIEPKAGAELKILLHGKINALDSIYKLLSRGELPLDLPNAGQQSLINDDKVIGYHQEMNKKMEIKSLLYSNTIATDQPWEVETYHSITEYLTQRAPYGVIEELEKVANDLRKALENNFTLTDILLDVRDARHADGAEEFLW